MTPSELDGLREFAVSTAQEAGRLTLRYFRGEFDVETKSDNSPVTRADREAEALIRRTIASRFPEDGILGEEYGYEPGAGMRTWVIDPIDGTKSFVAGVPLYAVLIALVEGSYSAGEIATSRVLAGVIHVPPLDETLSAARGRGAHWQTTRDTRVATVSDHRRLEGARIATSDFSDLHRREPDLARLVDAGSGLSRTWGDAYGYLLVATGRMDAMIDPVVSPWDIAPLPVIVEEAGGRYTALDGSAVLSTSAVATNGAIHDALLLS